MNINSGILSAIKAPLAHTPKHNDETVRDQLSLFITLDDANVAIHGVYDTEAK